MLTIPPLNSLMTTVTRAMSIQPFYLHIDQDRHQCLPRTMKSSILLICFLPRTIQSITTKFKTISHQTRDYVLKIILHILHSMSSLIITGRLIITTLNFKTKLQHKLSILPSTHTNHIQPTLLQKLIKAANIKILS